jgi:hypothetical protein
MHELRARRVVIIYAVAGLIGGVHDGFPLQLIEKGRCVCEGCFGYLGVCQLGCVHLERGKDDREGIEEGRNYQLRDIRLEKRLLEVGLKAMNTPELDEPRRSTRVLKPAMIGPVQHNLCRSTSTTSVISTPLSL